MEDSLGSKVRLSQPHSFLSFPVSSSLTPCMLDQYGSTLPFLSLSTFGVLMSHLSSQCYHYFKICPGLTPSASWPLGLRLAPESVLDSYPVCLEIRPILASLWPHLYPSSTTRNLGPLDEPE